MPLRPSTLSKRPFPESRIYALVREGTEAMLTLNPDLEEEDEKVVDGLLCGEGVIQGDILVIIHPTSRWLFKCWTDEGFAKGAILSFLQRSIVADEAVHQTPPICPAL